MNPLVDFCLRCIITLRGKKGTCTLCIVKLHVKISFFRDFIIYLYILDHLINLFTGFVYAILYFDSVPMNEFYLLCC